MQGRNVHRVRRHRRQRQDDAVEPGRGGAARARPARRTRARGGKFASRVTQAIRDLCRDARNLALVPRAELLLYVARDVQLAEEVVLPGAARADIVIADRYLYTAEVLARQVRHLPDATIRAIIDDAAGGVWPDLVVLSTSTRRVARGRRKVAKLCRASSGRRRARAWPAAAWGSACARLPGARGRATGALGRRRQQRRRLDELVADICDDDLQGARAGVQAAVASARAARAGTAPRPPRRHAAPSTAAEAALAAFLGWVDDRAQREPTLAAYVLAGLAGHGIDERRLALAARVPRVIARGLRGLSDGVSWQLRRSLVEAAPHEVAMSLDDQAAEAPSAWTLRELLAEAAPAEVASSLQGTRRRDRLGAARPALRPRPRRGDGVAGAARQPRAPGTGANAGSRERGTLDAAVASYVDARAAARSVAGLDDERAWAVPARRPHRRAGAGHRVARRPVQRARLALARTHARPRAQDRAVDDRRARRRPRLGDAGGDGVELPRGARFADRPRSPDRLGAARRLPRGLAGVRDQEPGRAGQRRARQGAAAAARWAMFPDNISLLKQAAGVATGSNLNPTVMAA